MMMEQKTLRAWRQARGVTQEQLALESGVSITTVQKIEMNRCQPRVATAKLLCDQLGIKLADVLWPKIEEIVPWHSQEKRSQPVSQSK